MKLKSQNSKAKILVVLTLGFVISAPLVALGQGAIDPAFNPSLLIPDEAFADVGTFGSAAGIQKFFEQHNSLLADTSQDFLLKLKEPDTLTKVALEDPSPNLGRLRTASELIYDASVSKGLNPQVMLVMLQKEQSLILGNFNGNSLQNRLDRALGFGCPDYEGCGVRVGRGPGVDASSQTFGRPIARTARKGDTIILDNTLGGFDNVAATQSLSLGNFATAALYRYTPHVFNGNYNFWRYYSLWFKYPNGTVIQLVGDPNFYVIDNGAKRPFSQFVATQRKINTNNVISVSQTEFDSYISEKPMPPLDSTLIKGDVSPAVYLIEDTKKHAISYPVFVQRKFSFANVVTLPQAEVDSYETGSFVAPVDGTLITGETDLTVYLVDAGLKRPISYEVL